MPSAVQDDAAMELRFGQMFLWALRGDTDCIKAALKELPAYGSSRARWGSIPPRYQFRGRASLLLAR